MLNSVNSESGGTQFQAHDVSEKQRTIIENENKTTTKKRNKMKN